MKVVMVEPRKPAYVAEIDEGLKSLQNVVGGYIQAVYPYEEPVALICNEEGKLLNMELNRALRDEDNDIFEVVAGTFIIVGLGDENFESLSDEMAEIFVQKFLVPEEFVVIGEKIGVLPFEG